MNILLDELPRHIEVCGEKYPINTDFRVWIRFEEMLFSDKPVQTLTNAILLCMSSNAGTSSCLPPSFKETLKALCDFYYCRTDTVSTNKKSCARPKMLYSFKHDAELIYAAFLQQYGIDLTECNMHWWKFRALFSALSGDLKICSVMRIRSMELSEVTSGAARSRLARLKSIYALPDFRSDDEREAELAEALW